MIPTVQVFSIDIGQKTCYYLDNLILRLKMIELSDTNQTLFVTSRNEVVPYTDDLHCRLVTRLQKWRFKESILSGLSQEKIASDKALEHITCVLPRQVELLYLVPDADKHFVNTYGEKIVDIVTVFLKDLNIKRVKYGRQAIPRVERNISFLAYFGFDTD